MPTARVVVFALLTFSGAPASAEPYRGPTLHDVLLQLRRGEQPITLGRRGEGSPAAIIARRGWIRHQWVIQRLELDGAAVARASKAARQAGQPFMPEDADACCRKPTTTLLALPTREALERALLDGAWTFESYLCHGGSEIFSITLTSLGADPARVRALLRGARSAAPTRLPAAVARVAGAERARELASALKKAGAQLQIEVTADLYRVVLDGLGARPEAVIESIAFRWARPVDRVRQSVRRLPFELASDRVKALADDDVASLKANGGQARAVLVPRARSLVLTGM